MDNNTLNQLNGLDALAFALEQAQETEARAIDAVIEAKQRLIKALGCKPEGSTTFHGSYYKATTHGEPGLDPIVNIERLPGCKPADNVTTFKRG